LQQSLFSFAFSLLHQKKSKNRKVTYRSKLEMSFLVKTAFSVTLFDRFALTSTVNIR